MISALILQCKVHIRVPNMYQIMKSSYQWTGYKSSHSAEDFIGDFTIFKNPIWSYSYIKEGLTILNKIWDSLKVMFYLKIALLQLLCIT